MLNFPFRKVLLPLAVLLVVSILVLIINTGSPHHSYPAAFQTKTIQHDFSRQSRGRSLAQPERLAAVKAEFLHAWDSYDDHGSLADELSPLSGRTKNPFCGWSATLVDALDTLWLMGLRTEFAEAVLAVVAIDFPRADNPCVVNLFETTIRHLGGLIAAYDLSGEPLLLPKMAELGDLLHRAFNTFNGLPCSHCNLMAQADARYKPPMTISLAAQGSLTLEFTRLGQILHDPKYEASVRHVAQRLADVQMNSSIPGLWPQEMSAIARNGYVLPQGMHYSLGALSDSTYEYLVKAHMLAGGTTGLYKEMWERAAPAIKKNLLFRPHVPGPWTGRIVLSGEAVKYNAEFNVSLSGRVQHLANFQGGMFALSAKMMGGDEGEKDWRLAQELTQGVVWAYNSTRTGIMPEALVVDVCEGGIGVAKEGCEWNRTQWEERVNALHRADEVFAMPPEGWLSVTDGRYLLRPEGIESVFYMWRMTGDEYWREVGWVMFQSIAELTKAPFGHAAIEDVTREDGGGLRDEMESFWFAETLKYFYLLFEEPGVVSLNEFVLNTEAHPFRLVDGLRGF